MRKKRFKRVFMRRLNKEVQTVYERAVIHINALLDMDACVLHGADVYGDAIMLPANTVEPVVCEKDVKAEHPYNELCVELRDKFDRVWVRFYASEGAVKDATRKSCIQDAVRLCDKYVQRISEELVQKYIEERENNHA